MRFVRAVVLGSGLDVGVLEDADALEERQRPIHGRCVHARHVALDLPRDRGGGDVSLRAHHLRDDGSPLRRHPEPTARSWASGRRRRRPHGHRSSVLQVQRTAAPRRGREPEESGRPRQAGPRLGELERPRMRSLRDRRQPGTRTEVPRQQGGDLGRTASLREGSRAEPVPLGTERRQPCGRVQHGVAHGGVVPVHEHGSFAAQAQVVAPTSRWRNESPAISADADESASVGRCSSSHAAEQIPSARNGCGSATTSGHPSSPNCRSTADGVPEGGEVACTASRAASTAST